MQKSCGLSLLGEVGKWRNHVTAGYSRVAIVDHDGQCVVIVHQKVEDAAVILQGGHRGRHLVAYKPRPKRKCAGLFALLDRQV